MKLFKNKFFIICLCVAVVLCAVPSTFALMGYGELARNIVGTVTMPLRLGAAAIENAFEGFGKYFGSIQTLREENEALREENQALSDRLKQAELLERENARLREYLDVKSKHPTFLMEEGMVISYSSGNYMTSFTLNRGTLHGIKKNMPVVVREGVVGYVADVGLNWCMVSTVIETASSVGAYIPRSGATGIVSGDASLRREGVCKISYMEQNADIQVGDQVLSSGSGSVYPADLVIGEVIAVEMDEYSRALVATVKPSVNFARLQYMMIITEYEN